MTYARTLDSDGTRPWHKFPDGRAKCGKRLRGTVETTEEQPLICLTCPRCLGYGNGIRLNTTSVTSGLTEAPAAVYGRDGCNG